MRMHGETQLDQIHEQLGNDAQRVLVAARREAARRGHSSVGVEHILLGLVTEPCEAATALVRLEVGPQRVHDEVSRRSLARDARSSEAIEPSELRYTSRAKRVLELAASEAMISGHSHVGTGALLLGLARMREGGAAEILASLGVGYEEIGRALHAIGDYQSPRAPAPLGSRLRVARPVWRRSVVRVAISVLCLAVGTFLLAAAPPTERWIVLAQVFLTAAVITAIGLLQDGA